MIENIRMRLEQLSEEDYKKFNENLLPGTKHVLGVRMPKLRALAKEIAKGDFRAYLNEAYEKISADKGSYHEEIMLEGLVIAYAKMELKERFFYLDRFVPKIHNWAVCDCSATPINSWKSIRKKASPILKRVCTARESTSFASELCPFWIILSMILILTGCFLYANIQDMKDIM